jgi:hypothetical protein
MLHVAKRSIPTCRRSFVMSTTADSAVAKEAVLSQLTSTAVAPARPERRQVVVDAKDGQALGQAEHDRDDRAPSPWARSYTGCVVAR